jgi:pSer/pThr/pTyr-binding forkhead associated (FHA) protein
MASREHALIKQNPDGFYIEDRGSRNGVFLNKEKITVKKLADGDEIQIGNCLFQYIEREAQEEDPLSTLSDIKEDSRPPGSEEVETQWALEALSGAESGKIFALAPQKLSLGRGKTDISINDPKISRHHADLEWTKEGFTIIDLKSTNGVFVNDAKVEKKLLSPEDIITVGSAQLKVVCKK